MLHHCVTHFTPHVHVLTNLVQKQCSNCFHTYSILYSMCVVELGVVLFATLSVTEGDSCIHIYVHWTTVCTCTYIAYMYTWCICTMYSVHVHCTLYYKNSLSGGTVAWISDPCVILTNSHITRLALNLWACVWSMTAPTTTYLCWTSPWTSSGQSTASSPSTEVKPPLYSVETTTIGAYRPGNLWSSLGGRSGGRWISMNDACICTKPVCVQRV